MNDRGPHEPMHLLGLGGDLTVLIRTVRQARISDDPQSYAQGLSYACQF
jgi:hypothetical protein